MAHRPSNTYASQGGSQRRRPNTQVALSDDSEEDEDYEGNGHDESQNGVGGSSTQAGAGGLKDSEIRLKAGQLARFTLFQEYKKVLIRRTDIVKNVLPNNTRSYNVVFAAAQNILKNTIGCELVEVRPRGKGAIAGGDAAEATQTQAQAKKGKGRARQNGDNDDEDDEEEAQGPTQTQRTKSASTKVYILRSTLPPDLLAAMSNPSPLPLGLDSEENQEHDSGALIQWEKGDGTSSGHIALLGIRTVILAIVLTSGRVITDDLLHAYLRRLNLNRETILSYTSTDSKEPPMTLDKYLDLLARQNYLEKVKIPGYGNTENSETCEWKWGQREIEFSEKDAAEFIEQTMMGREDEESSEEEEEEEDNNDRRRRRGKREKVDKGALRKKLRFDIVKAAGGELTG
ncbi:uncharacterized protein L201_005967 [Kwoniella dendrophila CBS 6074]|uniref:MAGE domain-containing protein n=1 Tax=Kwoniella dendrophila CBS 6074 TaxID=1295534 RepID=A0AAX4K0F6_9TREE